MPKLSETKNEIRRAENEEWLRLLEAYEIDADLSDMLEILLANGPGSRGGHGYSQRAVELPESASNQYANDELKLRSVGLYLRYLQHPTLGTRISGETEDAVAALRSALKAGERITELTKTIRPPFSDESHMARAAVLRKTMQDTVSNTILPVAERVQEKLASEQEDVTAPTTQLKDIKAIIGIFQQMR